MKKNIWFPVCVLILGILCASCDTSTSTSPKPDTWSLVTSLDQLNGTWKGSYKKTMPIKKVFELLDMTWDDSTAFLFGDMKVTISTETISTINASEKIQSGSVKMTLTFFDGTINYTWGPIKSAIIEAIPDIPKDAFDDKNHSITMTQKIDEQPITDEEVDELLSSGLQINQNGKKLKISTNTILEQFPEEIPPEIISSGLIPKEIIMTRQ